MVDSQYRDDKTVVVDLVRHSVRTPSSGPEAVQLSLERMTNAAGSLAERRALKGGG